jgi:hypothetical protein
MQQTVRIPGYRIFITMTMFWSLLLQVPVSTPASPPIPYNGIVVGQTKLYDERSLALMLQAAQSRLNNRDFFDQGTIAAQLGKMQGARLDASSFGVNVSTTPLPGVTTTTNTGDTTTFNEVTTQPSSPVGQPTLFQVWLALTMWLAQTPPRNKQPKQA